MTVALDHVILPTNHPTASAVFLSKMLGLPDGVHLGDGVRLYESVGTDPIVLTRTELAATGQLTDLRLRV